MQIIFDVLIAILVGYIAFTNFLAGHIEEWLTPGADTVEINESVSEDDFITVTSALKLVPDVLKNSVAYQQAATQSAIKPSIPTNNPIEAIVNIFCTSTTRTQIRTTTGTGFFIHSEGVILTNAHVAQFLLLTKTEAFGTTECLVRTGNPATPRYHADLLYISPAWVLNNATFISDTNPTGTGERDYALLYVTKSVDGSPLPTTFPALRTDTNLLPRTVMGRAVLAAGYPAERLLLQGTSANLVPQQANTTVTDLFTFGSNYADVMALRGTIIGEHGSSGGPVTTSVGTAIGMITTKGNDQADGPGSLRAITLSYIDRTIQEETGFSLERTMSGNLAFRSQIFTDTMVPFLSQIITISNTN